jgi:hypothetical protein
MKLKRDFVTNSSSTSYVIAIPKGFDIENHLKIIEKMGLRLDFIDDIEDLCSYCHTSPEELAPMALKELRKVFTIKDSCEISSGDSYIDRALFRCIIDFAKSLNLVFSQLTVFGGGDASDIGLIVTEEYINEFFQNWRKK